MRHSILRLMGFILALAVALAALRDANQYWADGLLMMTLLLLGTSLLAVVYTRGQSRAGWLGFLVFGGAYCALSMGVPESLGVKLPTTKFISYAHARVLSANRLRGKLVFSSVDSTTGVISYDEAGIRADPSQRWKAILPGAADFGSFSVVSHCLVTLLVGLLGAFIARRFEKVRVATGDPSG
jgi:hypothetical protein